MFTRILAFVLSLSSTALYAQLGAETPRSTQEQAPSMVRDAYQGGWSVSEGKKVDDSPAKEDLRQQGSQQQLDLLRWERNESLVRNAGAIPPMDQTRLVELATVLNNSAPGSFEAHMANYYTQFPAATAFQELELAKAKGQGRTELLAPDLVNAARKDDPAQLARCAKEMKTRGGIAPPLYAVAMDIMASLEPNAVLIAAGEMDAFPLWVEQFANGRHTDVLVVDERLLVDPGYRTRIWARAKAAGVVPEEADFIKVLAASSQRPVYLSLSLGAKSMEPLKVQLYVTGLAMRVSATPIQNIPLLEARWDRLKKPMDAGPLSRNYLLPGAVLLNHYRAIEDEARASRLELQLRGMAKALGATNALIQTGVLAH